MNQFETRMTLAIVGHGFVSHKQKLFAIDLKIFAASVLRPTAEGAAGPPTPDGGEKTGGIRSINWRAVGGGGSAADGLKFDWNVAICKFCNQPQRNHNGKFSFAISPKIKSPANAPDRTT
jgi:hypothetical protein